MRYFNAGELPLWVQQGHIAGLGLCLIRKRKPSGALIVLTCDDKKWCVPADCLVGIGPQGVDYETPPGERLSQPTPILDAPGSPLHRRSR